MVFEHPERHDPEKLRIIIQDQEQKALVALSSPVKDGKSGRVNITRRITEIEGRELAVNERWY